jgi:hypothetical protein
MLWQFGGGRVSGMTSQFSATSEWVGVAEFATGEWVGVAGFATGGSSLQLRRTQSEIWSTAPALMRKS